MFRKSRYGIHFFIGTLLACGGAWLLFLWPPSEPILIFQRLVATVFQFLLGFLWIPLNMLLWGVEQLPVERLSSNAAMTIVVFLALILAWTVSRVLTRVKPTRIVRIAIPVLLVFNTVFSIPIHTMFFDLRVNRVDETCEEISPDGSGVRIVAYRDNTVFWNNHITFLLGSGDSGQSWNQLGYEYDDRPNLSCGNIRGLESGTRWVWMSRKLHYTHNSGETWHSWESDHYYIKNVEFESPSRGVMEVGEGDESDLYLTRNGGETWEPQL